MPSAKHVQRTQQLKAATTRPATATAPSTSSTPLIDLTQDAFDHEAVEHIHLFTIGGVDYTIPSESPASLVLELLKRSAEDGEESTMWWLFNELLGTDGVEALRSYKGLSMSHLGQLFAACQETLTGQFADPKAPTSGGR